MSHQSINSTASRNNLYPATGSSSASAGSRQAAGLNDNSVSLFDLARIAVAEQDQKERSNGEDQDVLALARLGGHGGHVWVYKDAYSAAQNQTSAAFLTASHRQWF
jgi:hypothetical protein